MSQSCDYDITDITPAPWRQSTADTATVPQPVADTTDADSMATWSTGNNVTSGPLVIDTEGHILGGGEYAPIKANIMPCSRHIKQGRMVVVTRPEGVPDSELNPNAVAAWNETDALNAAGATATPAYAKTTTPKTSAASTGGTDTTPTA